MITHYNDIADVFNKVWKFSDGYKTWVIENINRFLELNQNDILIDIGGGTGTFTSLIKRKSNVKKAICVEPSSSMCNKAKEFDNIECICEDAYTFSKKKNITYNKILFKEVVHHIKDRKKVWDNLYKNIPSNSKILIITRPQNIEFPLFNAALEAFKVNQPPIENLINELENSKFQVTYEIKKYTFTLSTKEWYMMLENRFMSDLNHFTDHEIKLGIDELKQNHKGTTYDINDNIIFLVATKL